MQRTGQLLAILLAAILSMSAVVSTVVPAATVFPVFAEEHDGEDEHEDESEDDEHDDDDDNSGHGSDDSDGSEDETDDEHDDAEDGSEDEHDDEVKDEEDDDEHDDETEDHDEESRTKLKIEEDGIEVEIERKNLELAEGLYDVTFSCTDPAIDMAFDGAFEVEEEGEGEFEAKIDLEIGTYAGCEVSVVDPDMLLASFDAFTITGDEEDEVAEEIKLKVEDDGVEVEIEKQLDLEDGSYDATFACDDPAVSVGFAESLEVENGEGKFKQDVALEVGTYTGCEVTVDDPAMTLASFDAFTVIHVEDEAEDEHDEEVEDEREEDLDDEVERSEQVEEHRKERAEQALSKVSEIRERIANAEVESPGPVSSGLDYTLVAAGMTDEGTVQDTIVDLELLSWKSTPAVAILAVVGGEVEVGDTDYTVLIGFAIYSLRHDVVRVNALAVDEASGDVVKITLRGGSGEDVGFPDAAGESVGFHFEGHSGPQKNEIADVDVILDGTLEAG